MFCIHCNKEFQDDLQECRHCGHKLSKNGENGDEAAVKNLRAKSKHPRSRKFTADELRMQVMDIIIQKALKGDDWMESCAGPMKLNGISIQDVIDEIKRRGAILPSEH